MDYLPEYIKDLLIRSAFRTLSLEEDEALHQWMELHPEHQCLMEAARDPERFMADLHRLGEGAGKDWERSYEAFVARHLSQKNSIRRRLISRWYAAAAVILLMITAGLGIFRYYAGFKLTPDKSIVAARPLAEILLSNGQRIQLGNLAAVAAGSPAGVEAGPLQVDSSWYRRLTAGMSGRDSANRMAALSFNIATPKGGKYALALPDGSKVWMGAASSLHYSQNADARQVDMQGEVYFEIAKQPYQKNGKTLWRPFKVQAGEMTVEVWGTRFTVVSYLNSPRQTTTLFEGKVKVSSKGRSLFLSPGQRAELESGQLHKQMVDNSQGVALKEGYFIFKAETLSDILKEIGNWYNVSIVFRDDQIGGERFEAMLPRSSQLTDLLGAIESTGNISFRFKDRTIYVDKK